MFHDRERELKKLEEVYHTKGSKLVVVYGRRRVGKTALVREFSKNKLSLYFFVSEKDEKLLIEEYTKEIEEKLHLPRYIKPKFGDFEELMNFLLELSKDNKLIVIFDEFQNFRSVNPSIFSILQKLWDLKKDESNLMLVIVGSFVGLIKRIFMDKKEPLFGRVDEWIKLKPFDFFTAYDFVKIPIEDFIPLYSALGGMPKYLLYVQDYYDGNVLRTLERLFFDEFAPLREEGLNVLKLEFGRYYRSYFSILEAVSLGCTTPKEISDKTGLKLLTVNKYLSELTNHYEYLVKETPVTETKSRVVAYRIRENFLNFWFRFVYHNYTRLEEGLIDVVLEDLKKNLNAFVGRTFEDVSKEFLKRIDLGFKPIRIGRWWRRGVEIDIIAYDKENVALFEVKWSELKFKEAKTVLSRLEEKAEGFPLRGRKKFGIIGKRIEGKGELREEGYLAFDLDDFCCQNLLS